MIHKERKTACVLLKIFAPWTHLWSVRGGLLLWPVCMPLITGGVAEGRGVPQAMSREAWREGMGKPIREETELLMVWGASFLAPSSFWGLLASQLMAASLWSPLCAHTASPWWMHVERERNFSLLSSSYKDINLKWGPHPYDLVQT